MPDIKYTVLVDNLSDSSGLMGEHGLSILCQIDNQKILIDTGAGKALFVNAGQLNVDLSEIDAVILTHGHYDHAGGLLKFFSINTRAKVYLFAKTTEGHFLLDQQEYLDIGMNPQIASDYRERLIFIDDDTDVNEYVRVFSVSDKSYPLYSTNHVLHVYRNGEYMPDDFSHELIVLVNGGLFVDVITGCSHSGIANMILTVQKKTNQRIRYLFGGFHTGDLPRYNVCGISDEEVEALADFLQKADIEEIYTMHCTGEKYFHKLHAIIGDRIKYAFAGTTV
ncbi:MAG TPA: MBL fold metallo-hydrolase [Syntrophomonas sp.]|nr:MBL fold metallo-hydrolase [Syntrophomonas sp.]